MITKKLGKTMFAWDDSAMKGRGWWYVLGRGDSFARAASRKEASRLGLPKEQEKTPKDVEKRKYYYDINPKTGKPMRKQFRTGGRAGEDAPSKYEEADVIRQKSLMQIASERMLAGQGLGGSIKGAITDKLQAKATGIQRRFDPMNILSKIPGVGKLAATAYGKAKGRSAADISYFTGVHAPEPMEKEESEKSGFMRRLGSGKKKETTTKISGSNKMVSILKDIQQTIAEKFEEDTRIRETKEAFEEEQIQETERRHRELIDAIIKGTRPKDSKAKKEEKKGGIFDMIGNFLSKSFGSLMTKVGPILMKFGGGLMSLLGSLGSILGPLALVVGGTIAGAKVIDKGYEAITGKSSESYNKLYDPASTNKEMQDYITQRQRGGVSDKATEQSQAKDLEQYKKTGKITDITGKDVTKQRLGEIEKFKKYKEFKKTDPYQQYKSEVLEKDYKGAKRPTFEEWKAQKGISPKTEGQTASKIPEPITEESKQSYEMIGGQPVISGQPLSETQMAAANMSLQSGNKLMPETQKSYDLAKQLSAQPSTLGQRMNAATQENVNLAAPSAQNVPPVIVNKTNNVVNSGGASGGGKGYVRNDEPVLNRVQYQNLRAI